MNTDHALGVGVICFLLGVLSACGVTYLSYMCTECRRPTQEIQIPTNEEEILLA
jgi:hypothetical protein